MYKTGKLVLLMKIKRNIFVKVWENVQLSSCISCPFLIVTSLSLPPPPPLHCLLKIFYRVVADIAPGEELLLLMKSEDYPHDTMAPDIHGQYHSRHRPRHPHLEIAMEHMPKGPSHLVLVSFPG